MAQPHWVRDVGGAGNEHVADVRADADGSIYITGEFSGSIQLGGSTYVSSGAIDLFVARLSATGEVQWVRQGGGAGIDRGLKLAVGVGPVIAVAGEFMGEATVFGTALSSSGGTADMFVATLNKSDGSLAWVRQGGGPTGTDRPGGVSMAANGQVSVAGDFRGTASWEGNSLTSMMDGGSGQPSVDVFIVTYSPSGDLLWLKQGAASSTDTAVDLVHDAAGHLFITGQYSYDITFGQTYSNAMVNASFLLRMDADGNDVWFRRMGGGAFNHVRDLVFHPDGRLLITGDLQGTMVYSGVTNVNVVAGQPFAYYLLTVGADGTLLDHVTNGSQSAITVRGVAATGNMIAVYGAFECRFTDLCTHYGAQGIFMAVGDEDLFIARHASAGLALQDAQQFGGAAAKAPGAITAMADGDLVFSGGFQRNVIFPGMPGFTADVSAPGGGITGNGVTNYCGDPNYGQFAGSTSAGLMDGFVARGHVEGREPYDWWQRSGSGCDREPLEPCIRVSGAETCVDTVRTCGTVLLNLLMNYSFINSAAANFLGPPVNFLWTTGSTSATIAANTSGTYGVTVTSQNGCWEWTDSIVVIIDPLPAHPSIHDDVVVNQGVPVPAPIELCHPQTQWTWATSVPPGSTFWWQPPNGGEAVYNDSIVVDTTGSYVFHVVNEFGCERLVQVDVFDHPDVPMPDIGVDMLITYPQDTDQNDTISVCSGSWIEYEYTPTWTIDGITVSGLPDGLLVFWGLLPGDPNILIDDGPQSSTFAANEPGWRVTEVIVLVTNAPCAEDSLFFTLADSVYLDIFPPIEIAVDLTGPSVVCDGESITLTASCENCSAVEWSGTGYTLIDPWTIEVSGAGTFSASATVEDEHGCSYSASDQIVVTMPTGPVLDVAPTDGILCPGANATITTTVQGTDAIWYGPDGPITGVGTTLVTNVPGTYYLTLNVGGCAVVSNSVELFGYSTPFIALDPAPVLCAPGDQAVLQIMAAPSAEVQWHAPLSGGAFTQTVSEPGTYSCSVVACGIETTLSIEVLYAPIQATITTPGPYSLCGGDSVVLQAGPGADAYEWMPEGGAGSSITVSTAGNYQVVMSNTAGCSDTSSVIVVQSVVFNEPLEAQGDSICFGDLAWLTATGSGTITWFADPALSMVLGTGHTFGASTDVSITVYAQQSMEGCLGATDTVQIVVLPRPAIIVLDGPSALCLGEQFLLTFSGTDPVTYLWSTPTGTQTNGPIVINAVSIDDAGTYTCVPWYQGCSALPATHELEVFVPQEIGLPATMDLCLGGQVTLAVPAGFSAVEWSTGGSGLSITLTGAAEIHVSAEDPNGCPASAMVLVVEHDCEVIIPNVFTPNGDGSNDTWFPLGGFVQANARIWNRWGGLVHVGDMVTHPWRGRHQQSGELCADGVYYYEIEIVRADGRSTRQAGYVHLQ